MENMRGIAVRNVSRGGDLEKKIFLSNIPVENYFVPAGAAMLIDVFFKRH